MQGAPLYTLSRVETTLFLDIDGVLGFTHVRGQASLRSHTPGREE